MSAWPTIKLGELASFRNGLNYSSADNGSGLAVVGVSDFQDRSIVDFASLDQLAPSALGNPEALLSKDDILFVRSNGNRELIGRSLRVAEQPPMPTSHSGFTIRLRFVDQRADPQFFSYVLRSGLVRRHLSARGGGTNINNLNQGILANLQVPLPAMEQQRRIASILGAYDDLIEVNRKRVALLEDMARGLFEEWFVRFRFPGHEAVTMVETTVGRLPSEWRAGLLGDVVQLEYGKALKADLRRPGNVAVFGSGGCVGQHDQRLVEGPGVIVGRKGNVGAVIWSVDDFWPIDTVYYIVSDYPLTYLFHQLRRLTFQNTDAAVPGLNRSAALKIGMIIPPVDLCARYDRLVDPIIKMRDGLLKQCRSLAASRDLLLPRLISGQLSVTKAERELEAAA